MVVPRISHTPGSSSAKADDPVVTNVACDYWMPAGACHRAGPKARPVGGHDGPGENGHAMNLPRRALPLADLFQNLRGVLAEPRRRARGRHRLAVDHDRRADARDGAELGERARQIELHAAVLDMRIVEHLVEIVDRTGRHADRFELV